MLFMSPCQPCSSADGRATPFADGQDKTGKGSKTTDDWTKRRHHRRDDLECGGGLRGRPSAKNRTPAMDARSSRRRSSPPRSGIRDDGAARDHRLRLAQGPEAEDRERQRLRVVDARPRGEHPRAQQPLHHRRRGDHVQQRPPERIRGGRLSVRPRGAGDASEVLREEPLAQVSGEPTGDLEHLALVRRIAVAPAPAPPHASPPNGLAARAKFCAPSPPPRNPARERVRVERHAAPEEEPPGLAEGLTLLWNSTSSAFVTPR